MNMVRSLRRALLLSAVALLVVLLTGPVALAGNSTAHGHPAGGSKPTPPPDAGQKIVCLDAGHGGSDPGAVYGSLHEADLTLQIASILENELTSSGYAVIMTRTSNVSLTNSQRAEICNGSNLNGTNPGNLVANAVIAIHLNASSNTNVDYFQAFWGKKNKDLAFAKTITDNYSLASVNGSGNIATNSVAQFASGVLLKSVAPATLAETVFLSNPAEQQVLASGTRQPQIAHALYSGITTWLGPAQ